MLIYRACWHAARFSFFDNSWAVFGIAWSCSRSGRSWTTIREARSPLRPFTKSGQGSGCITCIGCCIIATFKGYIEIDWLWKVDDSLPMTHRSFTGDLIHNHFLIIIVNTVFEIFVDPVGIWNVFRTESICERNKNNVSQFMISNNPTVSLINQLNIAMELSISRSLL